MNHQENQPIFDLGYLCDFIEVNDQFPCLENGKHYKLTNRQIKAMKSNIFDEAIEIGMICFCDEHAKQLNLLK